MAVARSLWGHIERRDHRLMRRMNRWRPPRWIRIWTITVTRLGDGWVWYGLGLLLLGFGGPRRFAAVGAAAAAAVLGIFLFKALKHLSQRPRPCQIEPHCWSKILPPDQFSFPSGHAMTAFSIALVISYFYPSLEGVLLFLALNIAVSRIHQSWHGRGRRGSPILVVVNRVVMEIVQEFQAVETHHVGFLYDRGGNRATLNPVQCLGIFVKRHNRNFAGEVQAMQRIGSALAS